MRSYSGGFPELGDSIIPRHDTKALDHWRTVLANWKTTGLAVTAFCRTHSITVSNFYRWRKILSKLVRPEATASRSPKVTKSNPIFVPVRVFPDPVIEVLLPSGIQFRVPLSADAQQMARLALAFGGSSC